MMLRAEAPMVFRIAMSRVFSITSRISDATMLSAATITIRPMPMPMRDLLEQQRRVERLVHVGPVLRDVVGAEPRLNLVGDRRRVVDVGDAELDVIRPGLSGQQIGGLEIDEAVGVVELEEPQAERAGNLQPPLPRHHAHRRQRALRRHQRDDVTGKRRQSSR